MKDLERTLKALANRRRLAIVKYLKQHQPASVGDIAEHIDLSFKATSKHLGLLSSVNIVEKSQQSLRMFYRLVDSQSPAARHIISLL